MMEIKILSDQLFIANKALNIQNKEKKSTTELSDANSELFLQLTEKEKRALGFIVANVELDFQ
jgi:hypothetical protein